MMPISLRLPASKEDLVKRAAKKAGKTKTAFILDALHEKLQLFENREQIIRKTAGWLSSKEALELENATTVFEEISEGDWQ
jgi:uncharacterized protein (DUF1778 family)